MATILANQPEIHCPGSSRIEVVNVVKNVVSGSINVACHRQRGRRRFYDPRCLPLLRNIVLFRVWDGVARRRCFWRKALPLICRARSFYHVLIVKLIVLGLPVDLVAIRNTDEKLRSSSIHLYRWEGTVFYCGIRF